MSGPRQPEGPDAATERACAGCGGRDGAPVEAAERMFGMGGRFVYLDCRRCGALTLQNVPPDLAPYYPGDAYYSLAGGAAPSPAPPGGLRRLRDQYEALGTGRLGRALAAAKPRPDLRPWRAFFRGHARLTLGSRVLDVGCGSGALLRRLYKAGFTRLTGPDPYMRESRPPHPARLVRGHLRDLDGAFDAVVFNHSLEHMAEQGDALRHARRLLAPGGVCRVEMPVADCAARERYGPDWVELDPPRHLALHTRRSFADLLGEAGFRLAEAVEAGGPFEFWGSELYRRGLTLYDPEKGRHRRPDEVFTEADVARFEADAAEAVASGASGRVAFYALAP